MRQKISKLTDKSAKRRTPKPRSRWSSIQKIPDKIKAPSFTELSLNHIEKKMCEQWGIKLSPGWREAVLEQDRLYKGLRYVFHPSKSREINYPQYEEWRKTLKDIKQILDNFPGSDSSPFDFGELRKKLESIDDVSRRKLAIWGVINHLEVETGHRTFEKIKEDIFLLNGAIDRCLEEPPVNIKHRPTKNLFRSWHIEVLIEIFEKFTGKKAKVSAEWVTELDKDGNDLSPMRYGAVVDFVCHCLRYKRRRGAIIAEIEKCLRSRHLAQR
jgi:hypothetical protein